MGEHGSLAAGQVIGGYTVIRPIGAGGMGTVYLVAHPRLPRHQALKVLASALGGDPSFRERFRREADLAARLDHPNIVSVQDAGVDGDVMWIAMQYVDGTDTAAMLRDADGPLPAGTVVEIIAQVAAALDYAHAKGTLHRDVKPANILVVGAPASDGRGPVDRPAAPRALIGDFGVARLLSETTDLTGTGNMIGTLAYAAPEMFSGAPLTPAVDVYALGCTMYELLCGTTVFPKTDPLAMMSAHALAPVPRITDTRPDLPAALDDVIARALAKRPEDRFASCGELARAAVDALHGIDETPTRITPNDVDRTRAASTVIAPPPQVLPPHRRPVPHPVTAVGPPPGVSGPDRFPPSPSGPGPVPRRRSPVPWIIAGVTAVVLIAVVAVVAVVLRSGSDSTTTAGASTTETNATESSATDTTQETTAETTTEPGTQLTGTWRGSAGGDQTGFDVVATISSESPFAATVEYPQIGCAGDWSENSRQGQTLLLTETITSGTCVTSQITLTPVSDDELSFYSSYYSQSQSRTLVITSTLRRQ